MGFASESGYTPATIQAIMLSVMDNINEEFEIDPPYTEETFVGTNFYKYFYALMQLLQENEVKTSEIFLKLQQYFDITNEQITRPVVTNPGLLAELEAAGYVASIKKPIDADAGKVYVCVDTDEEADDYEDVKLEINTIIKESTAAGVVSQGTETSALTLTNGQLFDFKFALPNRIPVDLRLTITLSENNQVVIKSPEEIKAILQANIAERYRLGKNFEPQRYFSIVDAPWASSVLLEWSDDAEANYYDTVYDAAFDDLFTIDLADIHLVEV